MTKSELIDSIAISVPALTKEDVKHAVDEIFAVIGDALAERRAVEIRGFGTFSARFRRGHAGFNPGRNEPIALQARYVPHFKPSRLLNSMVDGEQDE